MKFIRIQLAYEVLSDPTSRSAYDSQLRAKEGVQLQFEEMRRREQQRRSEEVRRRRETELEQRLPEMRWTSEDRRRIEELKRRMSMLDLNAYDALGLTMGCTSEEIKRGRPHTY